MALQKRIEYPGALYHVMTHGNGFQWIYKTEQNLIDFTSVLKDVIEKYHFLIHCFVIMKNHYHIMIETPEANLSEGMKKLNRDFARISNWELGRKGSLFKQRYKSILIEKENYYLNVLRCIYQNPTRLGINQRAEEYPGSSLYYLAQQDKSEIVKILHLDLQKELIGSNNFTSKMIKFVNGEKESDPVEKSGYKYIIGDKAWIEEIKERYLKTGIGEEYIDSRKLIQNGLDEKRLLELTKGRKDGESMWIYFLSRYTSLTQKEIGERVGISKANTVAQRLKRIKEQMANEPELRKNITQIEQELLGR